MSPAGHHLCQVLGASAHNRSIARLPPQVGSWQPTSRHCPGMAAALCPAGVLLPLPCPSTHSTSVPCSREHGIKKQIEKHYDERRERLWKNVQGPRIVLRHGASQSTWLVLADSRSGSITGRTLRPHPRPEEPESTFFQDLLEIPAHCSSLRHSAPVMASKWA